MGAQQSKRSATLPTKDSSEPPPYAIHHTSQACTVIPSIPPKITALSVPRWKWSNEECRQWIYAFLVHCGRVSSYANTCAKNFRGPGILLFNCPSDYWTQWLGPIDGLAVWFVILDANTKEVPKGVHLHHFWPRKSDGTCSKCGVHLGKITQGQ